MTQLPTLPAGWLWSTVDQVGRVQLGRQRAPQYHQGDNMKPYLRVANVFEDRIDAGDVKQMHFAAEEFERYRLYPGDVLLCEGQTPELLGRPALYTGSPTDVGFTNSLIRFQAGAAVDPRWALVVFRHHMHSGRFSRESRITTNIAHLSASRFKSVEFPLPPLGEQRRTVDLLADHMSSLDAAGADLVRASRRTRALELAFVSALVRDDSAVTRPLSDLLDLSIGGVWGSPPGDDECDVDVLRVTELRKRGRLDPTTSARRSVTKKILASRQLEPGDLLLEKSGGGPKQPVGRVGIVGELQGPSVCSNFMQLMRPRRSLVEPGFLHLYLNALHESGGTNHMQRASTNIRNIKTSEYLSLEVPVPDLEAQRSGVASALASAAEVDRLRSATEAGQRRTNALRKALLAAAFSGRLMPAAVADDIEEMAGV